MQKKILCFLILILPTMLFALREYSFPGQDPLVEEAIITLVEGRKTDNPDLWNVWIKMEELWKMEKNPRNKSIIGWLRTWLRPPFDHWDSWVFKRVYCPHLLTNEEEINYPKHSCYENNDFAPLFYDPFYVPYLKSIGKYEEALEHFQKGTIKEFFEPIHDYFENEIYKLFRQAEAYDPDLTITWYYFRDTQKVYYSSEIKTENEYRDWKKNMEDYEIQRRISSLKEKLSPNEFEKLKLETHLEIIRMGIGNSQPTTYLTEGLARIYAKRGEIEKAIHYWELYISREDRVNVAYIGPSTEPLNLQEMRKMYLGELRNRGEVDKLHPFLYINYRPFKPKKGFTKGGKPFVSADSFLKALNIPFEWMREGKLLTIKKEGGTMKIANIKDKWWIYKDGERREVEGYIKDKELYLPLKELCELLNLKLEWDENTFIGKVFTK